VPFGEIGEPDQKIVWLETDNSMNISGFAEALLHAKNISIGELEIPVIDTPAFIVLKIFAWGDRGERTNKDLEDIEFILSKYEDDDLLTLTFRAVHRLLSTHCKHSTRHPLEDQCLYIKSVKTCFSTELIILLSYWMNISSVNNLSSFF